MFIPKAFKITDKETIYDIIEEYSFATMYSSHNEKPYATHLPLTLNRTTETLHGHFARANEQWKVAASKDILVTFHGPHCYISPSWYETNQTVPTWNYVAVHVSGILEIVNNEEEVWSSLQDLVFKYESPNSSYQLSNVDSKYIQGLSKGIVGFKININHIEGVAKLSQNHTLERQRLVAEHLEQLAGENEHKIADLMKNNFSSHKTSSKNV